MHRYNKLVGVVKKLVAKLGALEPKDPFRREMTDTLLQKLYVDVIVFFSSSSPLPTHLLLESYDLGVINSKGSIAVLDKLTASSFCRRRFAVVLVRLKMAESLKEAATFIEQGRTKAMEWRFFVSFSDRKKKKR